VVVAASCGGEACTLRAKGKLTNVKNDRLRPARCSVDRCELWEEPGLTQLVSLGLSGRTHKKAYRAIDNGKNVKAKVTVEATDAAGNVATAKRTITLVK
jgi:hypothetical protein